MKIAAIIIGVILLLIFILCITRLKIQILYLRDGENDNITFHVKAWFGLIHIRHKVPMVKLKGAFSGLKVDEETKAGGRTLKKKKTRKITWDTVHTYFIRYSDFLHKVRNLKRIMTQFLRHVYLVKLEWETRIGDKDAAHTGVLVGMVWGIKSMLVGAVTNYFASRTQPEMRVIPYYNHKVFRMELCCIVHFRLGHAILAGIRIILNMRKGREQIWQTTPSKV